MDFTHHVGKTNDTIHSWCINRCCHCRKDKGLSELYKDRIYKEKNQISNIDGEGILETKPQIQACRIMPQTILKNCSEWKTTTKQLTHGAKENIIVSSSALWPLLDEETNKHVT